MHEPTAHDRDAFLRRIADRLPFDEAERLDILRELAVHLADSTAGLEADGLTREAAERAAIERLGSPDRLANALTEARRSPRRLLAAAGAGTYAALGGALYGYLFVLLVVMSVSFATVGLAAALHLFGGSWGRPSRHHHHDRCGARGRRIRRRPHVDHDGGGAGRVSHRDRTPYHGVGWWRPRPRLRPGRLEGHTHLA